MSALPARRAATFSLLALVAAFAAIRLLLLAETPVVMDLVHPRGLRAVATVRIVLGFALGALTFAAAWLILRAQGQGLSALGWRTPARWPGWVAAGLLAILFIGFVGAGPLRGAPVFSDASPFRIFGALVMALIGGVFEESVFRGFVIGRARDAGLPTIVQVLASGFLFGLAHVGWGGLAGGFSVGAAVAAMVSTGVLGLLLAGVYLSGGRSLWPCMAAHALINLAIEPWLILSAISGGFGHP